MRFASEKLASLVRLGVNTIGSINGWARTEQALKNGGWGSIEREDLRKSDQWFLEHSGIGEILKKHGVEFLNITEENWGRRIADPNNTRRVIISASNDPLELGAFVTTLLGMDPHSVGYLRLAAEIFGVWNEESVRRGLESGNDILEER